MRTCVRAGSLAFAPWDGDALDAALDRVCDRFGASAVTRAALLGRSGGLSIPTLPD